MSGFSFSKLKQAKPSMRRRLFLYMGALAALLLVTLFAVLLLLGQLKSPREELAKSLTFRMEAFQSDMESLWRNVSVMGLHLSEDMTAILEKQTTDLSKLDGDADAVERLEEAMLEPLCQYVRQADCSGAFVVLNTSLVSADSSFSGLYVQRSNAAHTTSGLLLYRGMADIGRRHDVMPHRKWAQEFDLSEFPGFTRYLESASAPIERNCRTTPTADPAQHLRAGHSSHRPHVGRGRHSLRSVRLFGESDLLLLPSRSALRRQPTGLRPVGFRAAGLDISKGLLTYPANGFCFVPDELLTEKPLQEGLTSYTGAELSFVGLSRPFMAAGGDVEPHILTVLIPKSDYANLLLKSRLEIGGLLILLMFFGVVCCLFYTRRYFTPILEDIDHVTAAGGEAGNPFFEELLPLSDKLRVHERTITDLETERQDLRGQMEQAEANAKRLAQRRKDEIDPEEYQLFLSAYQKLGPEARTVIDAMVDGISVQVLAEQLGKKMSTVYSYRRDIYEKVGIQGENKLQQLRVRVSLMRREQTEYGGSPAPSNGENAGQAVNR